MGKNLPPVLMSDILSRLPVKSLLRFTSLSKFFCSEILSPDFIKRHYTLSLQTNTNLSLLITDIGVDSLIDFDNQSIPPRNIISLDFDSLENPATLRNPLEKSRVVGSCNGLLCLSTSTGKLALFNFATRKHRFLPLARQDFPYGAAVWTYGFGYDKSTDDYKVVRIAQIAELDGGRLLGSELLVYSLNANAWNKVTKHFPFALTFDQRMGIYVSGKLHFDLSPISQLCNDLEDRTYMIVAFDPDLNNYTEVPLPDCVAKAKVRLKLSMLGECLCMCPIGRRGFDSVWLMKEYGVKESWTKIISFSKGLQGIWCPVAYSLKQDKVLLQAKNSIFYWYDLNKKVMIKIKMGISLPMLSVGVASVDSLVSLKSKKSKLQPTKKSEEAEKPKTDSTKKRDAFMSWMKLTL